MSISKGTPASSQIITLERMLSEREDEITRLRAEAVALKGQHKGLVLQNALLRQRPDLPVDRIPAAREVDALRAENARLRQLEASLAGAERQQHVDLGRG